MPPRNGDLQSSDPWVVLVLLGPVENLHNTRWEVALGVYNTLALVSLLQKMVIRVYSGDGSWLQYGWDPDGGIRWGCTSHLAD